MNKLGIAGYKSERMKRIAVPGRCRWFLLVVVAAIGLPPASVWPAETKQPTVKLIEPGAEPRQELRYKVPHDLEQTVKFKSRQKTTTKMDGNEMPMPPMPQITLTYSVDVEYVSQEGEIRYLVKLANADVTADAMAPPQIAEMMKKNYDSMTGKTAEVIVDNRGVIKSTKVKGSTGGTSSDDSFGKDLAMMATPLPMEPVGIGAQWQTTRFTSEGGVRMSQSTIFTLKERAGDVITLELAMRGKADMKEAISAPNAPPGSQVLSMTLSGKGKATANLTKLAPLSASFRMSVDTKMNVAAGPTKMEMTMESLTTTAYSSE